MLGHSLMLRGCDWILKHLGLRCRSCSISLSEEQFPVLNEEAWPLSCQCPQPALLLGRHGRSWGDWVRGRPIWSRSVEILRLLLPVLIWSRLYHSHLSLGVHVNVGFLAKVMLLEVVSVYVREYVWLLDPSEENVVRLLIVHIVQTQLFRRFSQQEWRGREVILPADAMLNNPLRRCPRVAHHPRSSLCLSNLTSSGVLSIQLLGGSCWGCEMRIGVFVDSKVVVDVLLMLIQCEGWAHSLPTVLPSYACTYPWGLMIHDSLWGKQSL